MTGNIKVRGPKQDRSLANAGNTVKKIHDRQLAAPAVSSTLQDLVKNEIASKKHTATEGLLWLVRYCSPRFIHHLSTHSRL